MLVLPSITGILSSYNTSSFFHIITYYILNDQRFGKILGHTNITHITILNNIYNPPVSTSIVNMMLLMPDLPQQHVHRNPAPYGSHVLPSPSTALKMLYAPYTRRPKYGCKRICAVDHNYLYGILILFCYLYYPSTSRLK